LAFEDLPRDVAEHVVDHLGTEELSRLHELRTWSNALVESHPDVAAARTALAELKDRLGAEGKLEQFDPTSPEFPETLRRLGLNVRYLKEGDAWIQAIAGMPERRRALAIANAAPYSGNFTGSQLNTLLLGAKTIKSGTSRGVALSRIGQHVLPSATSTLQKDWAKAVGGLPEAWRFAVVIALDARNVDALNDEAHGLLRQTIIEARYSEYKDIALRKLGPDRSTVADQ
jgi:hypothetical protein